MFTIYPHVQECALHDMTEVSELPTYLQNKVYTHIKLNMLSTVPLLKVHQRWMDWVLNWLGEGLRFIMTTDPSTGLHNLWPLTNQSSGHRSYRSGLALHFMLRRSATVKGAYDMSPKIFFL